MTRAGGQPITVLHVDDEPDFAELVGTYLERSHDAIDVKTATSARDGLEILDDQPIDCVVSDHDMPGMDGLEFLRAVRDEYPELPFVLFTGKGNEEIASDAISAGVTEYLQKGTGTDQYAVLANRIERAVEEYRAKAALEESERTLSTLISNLPGMAYRAVNDRGWPMEFVSDGCRDLTGYDPDELVDGDVVWGEDVLLERDREQLWETVQAALDAREPFEITYRIETASGEEKWVWEQGRGVFEDDDLIALEGIILDLDDRLIGIEDGEAGVGAADVSGYERVLERVDDGFLAVDDEWTITYLNSHAEELVDREADSLLGTSLWDAFPETVGSPFKSEYVEAMERQEQVTFTASYDPVDRWFEVRAYPAPDGLSIYFRDVTDRQQREQELERYATIIQAVDDPVYTLDADGRFTFVNDAVEQLTGYTPDELIGESTREIIPERDYRKGLAMIEQLLENPDQSYTTYEIELFTKEGDTIPAENHIALLPSDDGFVGTAGVIRDITDRKEREQRLEEFAGVVSHDLQSPLNVITGRAQLALETGDLEHVEDILDAASRMDDLIDDLLMLAHEGETVGEVSRTDLPTVVEDAWSQVETTDGTLDVATDATLEADPDRLRELLANLFANAVTHGGTDVTVRVGGLENGFFVADDGEGIPPDERDHVFEHGYSTSEEGTGLGLTIVARIADAHGWDVRVTESDAGGARFEVRT